MKNFKTGFIDQFLLFCISIFMLIIDSVKNLLRKIPSSFNKGYKQLDKMEDRNDGIFADDKEDDQGLRIFTDEEIKSMICKQGN